MVHKYEPEMINNRMQIAYNNLTRERQTFMQDLDLYRRKREKNTVKGIKYGIGPLWYQVLSCPQREALDTLEFCIYQDILEGRPVRTASIMKQLGLYPRLNNTDLMSCVYHGRDDPKQMLAKMFHMTYSHDFCSKRLDYPLNAKLMLSAILYLGLDTLISQMKKKFQPDKKEASIEIKEKPKPLPPPVSPYLQKMTACIYIPPKKKPFKPAPLPNLDDFNEPFEEEPSTKPPHTVTMDKTAASDKAQINLPPKKKPLKPAPLPNMDDFNEPFEEEPSTKPPHTVTMRKTVGSDKAPKKRIPLSYCEKIAGIQRIEPHSSVTAMPVDNPNRPVAKGKHRKQKPADADVKRSYGMGGASKKEPRTRKPVAPSTGIHNAQYAINSVFTINGKSFYVLGSVSILPPEGVLIHGGFKYINGNLVNVHCGYQGRSPQPLSDPCDCVNKWQDVALDYVKRTKCRCNHYYDYGNEGTFPPSELPYFEGPTEHLPFQFNYDTIYDLDEKHLLVRKEFKRFWDTDSVVHIGDPTFSKSEKKKKKMKRASSMSLGTPEDYLKCAMRNFGQSNIAANLPDIHLVPELKEWMRYRIHGPLSPKEKKEKLTQSTKYWQTLLRLSQKGFGHVYPPKEEGFTGHTTWAQKQKLIEKFRKFTEQYRLELYRSYAAITNMLWPTMFQAQFPDKSFRQVYFSYLFSRLEDVHLMRPYSTKETMMKMIAVDKNRYRCPLRIEPQ